MRVSVIQAENRVSVDGVSREVDLTALDPRIRVITFNTVRGYGVVEYDEGATEQVEVRDLEAERLATQEAISLNKKVPTEPLYTTQTIIMEPRQFQDWNIVRPYYDAWVANAPEVPPPPTPEELASIEQEKTLAAELEDEVKTSTLGTAEPRTLAQLKSLTRAEFRAWYDANFTTEAQVRRLVRWILFQLVRRF